MKKQLKVIELFNGLKIKVCNDGTIYTFDHKYIKKDGKLDNRKGRKIKPSLDKYGYYRVTFSKQGDRKSYCVHRLVALAFIPNPENKPTVNHKDGCKTNNFVDIDNLYGETTNLEWATHKEQKRHSIEYNLCQKNVEALQKANTRRAIPVEYKGKKYVSIRNAAKENGVHERVIKRKGKLLM